MAPCILACLIDVLTLSSIFHCNSDTQHIIKGMEWKCYMAILIQSNFKGSNTFGTTKICSRQGLFEPLRIYYRARSGGIIWLLFRFSSTQYTIPQYKNENHPTLCQICNHGICSMGPKNEFETAVVNEPSVFEALKFYCTWQQRQLVKSKSSSNFLAKYGSILHAVCLKIECLLNS